MHHSSCEAACLHSIGPGMVFSRLIRFRGEDGKVYFGEPEINDADELLKKLESKSLYTSVFTGSSPFDLCSSSTERKKVEEILPILLPSNVPIVRCIGLNYIKHSKLPFKVLTS